MAVKIINICDRCKKERDTNKCTLYSNYKSDKQEPYKPSDAREYAVDLCLTCMTEIARDMRGEQ